MPAQQPRRLRLLHLPARVLVDLGATCRGCRRRGGCSGTCSCCCCRSSSSSCSSCCSCVVRLRLAACVCRLLTPPHTRSRSVRCTPCWLQRAHLLLLCSYCRLRDLPCAHRLRDLPFAHRSGDLRHTPPFPDHLHMLSRDKCSVGGLDCSRTSHLQRRARSHRHRTRAH